MKMVTLDLKVPEITSDHEVGFRYNIIVWIPVWNDFLVMLPFLNELSIRAGEMNE